MKSVEIFRVKWAFRMAAKMGIILHRLPTEITHFCPAFTGHFIAAGLFYKHLTTPPTFPARTKKRTLL